MYLNPIEGKKFSVTRKELEIESQLRVYFPLYTYAGVNGEDRISKILTRYHTFFTSPVFCILECSRTGGTVYDYSGNDNDFAVHGFESDLVTAAYWPGEGYRWANVEPFRHLELNGSSWLQLADNSSIDLNDDFTFVMFFTRSGAGEEFLLEKSGSYLIKINSSDKVEFSVTDGTNTDTIINDKVLSDSLQHVLTARWDKSEKKLYLKVDDVENISSVAGDVADIAINTNDLYLFRDAAGLKYFNGYAHSIFLEGAFLSDADLADLIIQKEPFGYEIDTFEYDDGSGTNTSRAYALWKYRNKHPYVAKQYGSNFNFNNNPTEEEVII